MKPVIGITVEPKFEPENVRSRGKLMLNWNYPEEVAKCGGVPLLIPPMADMAEVAQIIDGWLIPGGLDIDASNFGQDNHPEAELQDPSRYSSEAALYAAVPEDLPILGICYGCQLVNVIAGGDLIQHLPDVVDHGEHSGGTDQSYEIDPSSQLAAVIGRSEARGKSFHHQAVGKIGTGLRVSARHEDGTVEAVEGTGSRWLIGVQWHPERTPDHEESQRLFRAFIEAARAFRAARRTP